MLQRDGYNETGCFNMDCSGFIRADGAVVAPGDVIKRVSGGANGPVQNITMRVLKVPLASFVTHFIIMLFSRKYFPFSVTKVDNGVGFCTTMLKITTVALT
jgi:hypothetical protein